MSDRDRLRQRLALVVITDEETAGRELTDVVRLALAGGATAIQLRGKSMPALEMVALGRALRVVTIEAGALLFINDRVDIALIVGADGAHLGDEDLPVAAARDITPPGFLLGRSVDSPDEARLAEAEGADYLGVGPVLATPSKLDAGSPLGAPGISVVRAATSLPLVAIGGISATNAAEVCRAGADGVAVIRAVMRAPDASDSSRRLVEAVFAGRSSR